MADLACKHCGSASFVRNGMAAGHPRYRCKACGRNFTATPARGKPPAMKALAVLLYALGNVSQGMIAKLLGVRADSRAKGNGLSEADLDVPAKLFEEGLEGRQEAEALPGRQVV